MKIKVELTQEEWDRVIEILDMQGNYNPDRFTLLEKINSQLSEV